MAAPAPGPAPPEWTVQVWQVEDGLPQSSVLSIAQTPEGYLWLGTFNGLARFDGVRFTVFDPANSPDLPSGRIHRLLVDRAGALWITTETKSLVRRWQGRFQALGAAEGIPGCGVERVGEDGLGRVWMADTESGLHRWNGQAFVPVLGAGGFGRGLILQILGDDTGGAWFRQGDTLARHDDGRFTPLRTPAGGEVAAVRHVCPSRDGGWWVVLGDEVRRFRQGRWLEETRPAMPGADAIDGLVEDRAGNLWAATYGNGLFRAGADGAVQHLSAGTGLTSRSVRSLFHDREGNLWVGTDGGGLHRIKPCPWKLLSRREGLGVDAVHSVCQDPEGRIWFAGGTTRPYWLDRGRVSAAIPAPQSDVLDGVWAVLPARDGAMWIGTYGGNVFRYADGRLARFGVAEGMNAGPVRALLEDRHGALWVGGFKGLSRIHDGRVTHFSGGDGLSADKVWALAEDSHGTLYVGTSGGGLNVLREGRFSAFTRRDGLPDNQVAALHLDAEETLWIGTAGGGLSRFKAGRFANFQARGGLPLRQVGPLLADDDGFLWMASDRGIVRARRRDLNDYAEGRRRSLDYAVFDRSDGLATSECSGVQPACLKARDGTLWFGTSKGAVSVDPKAVGGTPPPPPVIIEEVWIDDEVLAAPPAQPGAVAGHLTVPPNRHRIEFHFTSLGLATPGKTRFRHKLEPYETDWEDDGTVRRVQYTRLPPGRYRLHVVACNNDGVWNEAGAALAVTVLPAWWQTWWFRAGAFAGMAGLVFGFYEWRIHLLKRHRAAQREFSRRLIASQETERQRLAGELHDSLGQQLLVIKNTAAFGLRAAPGDPALSGKLDTISTLASQAIGEVRQIARALRPFELDRLGLTKAIVWLIKPAADSSCIRFQVQVDELGGLFPPESEINLYRIVQEGLANILKHSHAASARIEVRREPRQVRLLLQDDGRGFVPPPADAPNLAGMGLTDVTERVRILGGHLAVESAPGAGTALRITVPLPDPDRPPPTEPD